MKIGVFQMMIRLFCCSLLLFPHYALAGSVNIPGFKGTVTPRTALPLAPASAPVPVNVAIPGFYGPAVTPPQNTQLPIVLQNGQNGVQNAVQGANVSAPSQNQLTIQQNQQQAIINWASFNIGADASVIFDQQKHSDWVALNRIWDANPSLIFGKLSADGKIYLINQNGILFGPGSKVNVNSLAASSLNIKDADFLNNTLHFVVDDYQNPDPNSKNPNYLAAVSNFGEINAADGGYVFLMAPRVENFGTVNAPAGQIGLVAGTDVQLLTPQENDTSRSGFYVVINDDFVQTPKSTDPDFGRAVNRVGGNLYADGGVVGMYGNNVDQWGVIRSVTAFQNKNGQVELRAANKITTGANSSIELPVDDSVDPVTGLPPTISDTFDIQPVVFIGGLSKTNNPDMKGGTSTANEIELRGSIVAPSGIVTLRATDRVYMESGSTIDVSGVVADLPVAVLADTKLTSVELRDDYDQKDGVLQGEKITTSVASGSSIGDISQALLTRDKTAQERLVGGDVRKVVHHDDATGKDTWQYVSQTGNIDVNVTSGDIIVKEGAALNFAGGVINYKSGLVDSTKLLSGTQIYDISKAPVNVPYSKLLGNYEKTYDRFGIQETYSGLYYGGSSSLKTYVKGYTQGGDAGTLSLTAPTVVLDGKLNGSVTRGTYQNAWTTKSSYATDADFEEALMLSKAQGLETPRAGTLNIGDANNYKTGTEAVHNNPTSISVISETDPHTALTADSPLLTTQPTQISAKTINDAMLGTVNLAAELTIDTQKDASLTLQPGGTFSAQARRIDHEGSIKVPGGEIDLTIVQNNTSQLSYSGTSNGTPVSIDERLILGKNSVLDASGERIDNSQAAAPGNEVVGSGRTSGGAISVMDETDLGAGVFIQAGAIVDVSGGYTIDQKGKVTGGNAGSLRIQGSNIELDGDLRGYALADPNGKILGGAITLSSTNITVAPASSIPQTYDWSGFDPFTSSVSSDMKGKLYIADNRFDDTGFTRITLNSQNDLTIDQNATIKPSLVRLSNPTIAQSGTNSPVIAQEVPGRPDLIHLDDAAGYMAGPSSFTANAAISFLTIDQIPRPITPFTGNLGDLTGITAHLTVSDGAVVQTTPGGNISLVGSPMKEKPCNVTVYGMLDSPAGNINVNATNGDLLVGDKAVIEATGYNLPDPSSTPKGFGVNYRPMDGGNVSLTASGNLTLDASSDTVFALVNVSGADVVQNTVLSNGKITTYKTASNPGSVSLSYGSEFNPYGAVEANHAQLEGLSGGSLAITDTNTSSGLDVSTLNIRWRGFDDLTFRSNNSLIFSSDINNLVIGRKLTLDAPKITGEGTNVSLSAPWIVLTNTSNLSPLTPANSDIPTAGLLKLSGAWTDASGVQQGGFIDVIGDIQISGFQNVTLQTERDIRLSQALYDNNFTAGVNGNSGTVKKGLLATTGNLTVDADRIYPGNYYNFSSNTSLGNKGIYPDLFSDYTIHANGKVTLQHTIQSDDAATYAPIYSAGGSLTIEGLQGIDVEKNVTVAAPLGSITLSAPGKRIYLADGSILTTAGSDVAVSYGLIDSNNLWVTRDKSNPGGADSTSSVLFTEDSLPQKSVTLNAGEVIAREGSVIDVSGGGSVFAYKFQPGVEGSVDPLTKPGRYVVFKADSNPMPGTAVYLQGGGGLSAGMYTMLPLDAKHPQNARYAFMPGAHIIEAQSGASLPGQGALSTDGYPLIVGYAAVADTSIKNTRPQVYTVRTASDVLNTEGNYVKPDPFVSGDAGGVTIKGNTMILDGRLIATALNDGYQSGKISLSAMNITVQSASTSQLSDYFNFDTSFDDSTHPELLNFKGGLTVSADGITGFREVDLGDANSTKSITINTTAAAPLQAAVISLAANQITITDNSSLQAVTVNDKNSGEGVLTLTAPGTLTIGSATLYATNAVSINANKVAAMKGSLGSDNGALTLASSAIYFDDGTPNAGLTGLHLTQAMWDKFGNSGFQDFTLVSNSGNNAGIQFLASVDLKAGNSLTLDASRIVSTGSVPIAVTLEAPTINFKNSGSSSTLSTNGTQGNGTFTATAGNSNGVGTINVGEGDVLFANFNKISLVSQNDLTLLGKGSLSTGNADLAISTARVTTASTSRTVNNPSNNTQTTAIDAPDFVVYTGGNYVNDVQSGLNPAGAITINGNGNYTQSPTGEGGTLDVRGASIMLDNGGVVQVDGGWITMSASGQTPTDGITLSKGSMVLAQGTGYAPGGQVFLQSTKGGISIDGTSMIDVSAGYTVQNDGTKVSQGDAGLISLVAPNGGVAIDGIIEGAARGSGKGGSFILDTNNIGDITALNDRLTTKTDSQGNVISGGFTESLDLRASTGDIDIVSGQSLLAHDIKLTADGGNIDVNGNITAAAKGSSGGSVELYAMNNVNVNNGGSIRAVSTGTGSLDPNVLLSSNQGSVNVNGMIDVSGTNSTDSTGIVYLRAPRNKQNNDVNINIAGTITGDNAIYVEAFRTYDISNTNTISTPPAALTIWIADALNFSANNQAIATRLGTGSSPTLHLLPGIELDSYKNNTGSAGDITWNTAWNQGDANGIRFGGEPGVLTLRAAGDLNINGNLTDSPSGNYLTSAPPGRNSWGFNLVAGADSSSADYMAVNTKGTGNLRIADNVTVYTEGAPIRFASGGDTVIGAADQPSGFMMTSYMMNYNLASFTGSIHGNVGRDLSVAGAVQTATGDIDIKIGRDLNLLVGNDSSNLGAGAIRTTGQLSPGQESMAWGTNPLDPMVIDPVTGQSLPGVTQSDIYQTYYWRYDKGGNINLVVGRQAGKLNNSSQWVVADNKEAWDYFSPIEVSFSQAGNGGSTTLAYYGVFSADYENGTAGLATMGGGNLTVLTGGDFLAQAGTFGAGNLTIYSGGDIKGRFLNKDGQGVMHAMGNFGSYDKQAQIELLNSRQMNVTAEGEIQIGEVLNPTLASDKVDAYRDSYFVQCTYTPDTSISLKAGTDVTLAGNSPYYENKKVSNSTLAMENERVLPATVSIDAKDDIYLLNNFTLASSPTGNLSLDAAGDVIGQVVNSSNGTYQSATLLVSDVSPQNWYGLFYIAGNPNEQLGHWIAKRNSNLHGLYDPADNTWSYSEPLHTGDDQPVTIHADEDIKNLNLKFPKKAEVTAGRDIVDITYEGQNISPDDVSMIRAGMDISMRYFKASQTSTNNGEQIGLIQGGPGVFLVQAAGSIDLGSSLPDGIQEIGNGNDPAVWPDKSSLIILSGYSFGESNDDVSSLFKTGNDVGQFFSNIRNAGDEYAKLMADGKLDDAATLLQSTRNTYITPLLNTASGTGDINMTSSQISTSNAASDIFVIANGNLNLGKTALPNAGTVNTTTGITTANGGAINIFAVKDVNVQESRVMTFFSRQDMTDPSTAYGDITVWSDQGSINAGRGSRTAVSASPPKRKQVSGQPGVYMTVFTPPAVGSGIRAMTYGDNAPDPGNIHLFAPSGVIDAGEAGIAGGTVTLAALTVTNAANISFSAGSIGVPQQSAATTNLGTLTGSGSATQNSQLTSDVAGIDVARAQASQMIEDIIAKWLDVKVIDFVEDDNSGENK